MYAMCFINDTNSYFGIIFGRGTPPPPDELATRWPSYQFSNCLAAIISLLSLIVTRRSKTCLTSGPPFSILASWPRRQPLLRWQGWQSRIKRKHRWHSHGAYPAPSSTPITSRASTQAATILTTTLPTSSRVSSLARTSSCRPRTSCLTWSFAKPALNYSVDVNRLSWLLH